MRDETYTTRYFSFDLPKLCDGDRDDEYGVNRVVLDIDDIRSYFDCPYHRFCRGAAFYKGKIYSLEGFTNSEEKPPAMRVIDVTEQRQTEFVDLVAMGYTIEPELIDFYDDVCYYGDNHGDLYVIEDL